MAFSQQDSIDRQAPWLPGEHFELALDARAGMSTAPIASDNVLTVTTRRATKLGSETGKRTTSVVPLKHVTAVEVIDAERPTERLAQGLVVLAIGALLGLISWIVLNVELITLVVGGLPALVAIYILAGYLFPDTEGELVLHTGSFTLRQPLRTPDARRDAYLVAHRIYDLMMAGEAWTAVPPRRQGAAAAERGERPEQAARTHPAYEAGHERRAGLAEESSTAATARWGGGPTNGPASGDASSAAAAEHNATPRQPSWPQPGRSSLEGQPSPDEQLPPVREEPRWPSAWTAPAAGSDAAEPPARAHFAQAATDDEAATGRQPAEQPTRQHRQEADMASEEAHREEMAPAAEHAFEDEAEGQEEPSRREER